MLQFEPKDTLPVNTPEHIPHIEAGLYTYHLPPNRIAQEALSDRDSSKLLVCSAQTNAIEHRTFRELPSLLPADSLMIVNRSRVVAARLLLKKTTGGAVEVLLTSPREPSTDPAVVLASSHSSVWNCLIGGRNVGEGTVLTNADETLQAHVVARNGMEGAVRLSWIDDRSLSEMLSVHGHIPLPPYIDRSDRPDDASRYQTIFAKEEGSVAAPTAGLHFTDHVKSELAQHGIGIAEVLLHVGLGTFKPIDVEDMRSHLMHEERIEITTDSIDAVLRQLRRGEDGYITCVGTTSLRVIESVHWFGARLATHADFDPELIDVEQWSAFDPLLQNVSAIDSYTAVQRWMQRRGFVQAWGVTRLLIAPGCKIAVSHALVTNFHQPSSTLLLLVATFVGDPLWRSVYYAALENEYRFLSYGDASLLRTRM